MMKKIYFLLSVLCLLVLSCQRNREVPNEENEKDELTLEGTKWRLAHIMGAETGVVKVPEPNDCIQCYTFELKNDSIIKGFSSANELTGSYSCNYNVHTIFIHCWPMTLAGETEEAKLYVKGINKAESFSLQKNELILYYNDRKNNLLFTPYTP